MKQCGDKWLLYVQRPWEWSQEAWKCNIKATRVGGWASHHRNILNWTAATNLIFDGKTMVCKNDLSSLALIDHWHIDHYCPYMSTFKWLFGGWTPCSEKPRYSQKLRIDPLDLSVHPLPCWKCHHRETTYIWTITTSSTTAPHAKT